MVSRTCVPSPLWSQSVEVRVAVEGQGYLGFIEVDSKTTLKEARSIIYEEFVENNETQTSPEKRSKQKREEANKMGSCFIREGNQNFRFLLPDGVPISMKQESKQYAVDFLPCLSIRLTDKIPQLGPLQGYNTTADKLVADSKESNQSTQLKTTITVQFKDDVFTAWVTPSYTFGQLRRDAARFWNVKPTEVVLWDAQGCSWPEDTHVNFALHSELAQAHGVYMCLKAEEQRTEQQFNNTSNTLPPTSSHSDASSTSHHRPRSSVVTMAHSSPAPKHQGNHNSVLEVVCSPPHLAIHAEEPIEEVDDEIVLNRYSQLWRIFSYYCVQGDALLATKLDSRRFILMMRDARVASTMGYSTSTNQLTSTALHLIYTSAINQKKVRNIHCNKMNFDQFLDALVEVARRCFPHHLSPSSAPQHQGNVKGAVLGVSKALTELLTSHVLPYASSWSSLAWYRVNRAIYTTPVLSAMAPFVNSLYELFKFYSPPCSSAKLDMDTDMVLDLVHFSTLLSDLNVSEIGVTSTAVAEVFLASAESRGLGSRWKTSSSTNHKFCFDIYEDHGATLSFDGHHHSSPYYPGEASSPTTLLSPLRSCVPLTDTSRSGGDVAIPATPTTFLHADGTAAWDHTVLYFPQFLDAMVRVALFAFGSYTSTKSACAAAGGTGVEPLVAGQPPQLPHIDCCPPQDMVLALFQHISKVFKRSYVNKILEKRRGLSTYPAGLLKGTRSLVHTFTEVWYTEGQPDFLSRRRYTMQIRETGNLSGSSPRRHLPPRTLKHHRANVVPNTVQSPRDRSPLPSSPTHSRTHRGVLSSPSGHAHEILVGDRRKQPILNGRAVLSQLLHLERLGEIPYNVRFGHLDPNASPHRNRVTWNHSHGGHQPIRYAQNNRSSPVAVTPDPQGSNYSHINQKTENLDHTNYNDNSNVYPVVQQKQKAYSHEQQPQLASSRNHRAVNHSTIEAPISEAEDKDHRRRVLHGMLPFPQHFHQYRHHPSDTRPSTRQQQDASPSARVSATASRSFLTTGRNEIKEEEEAKEDACLCEQIPEELNTEIQNNTLINSGSAESGINNQDKNASDCSTYQQQDGSLPSAYLTASALQNTSSTPPSTATMSNTTNTKTNAKGLLCLWSEASAEMLLTEGHVFLKHGRRGVPHRRYVWFDAAEQRICWCPLPKKH